MEPAQKHPKRKTNAHDDWLQLPIEAKNGACHRYYREFFPFDDLSRFICCKADGEQVLLDRQVFALFGVSGRVVSRHAEFPDPDAWRKTMTESAGVGRVEIGAVRGRDRARARGKLERAMLAFDMDVEDYAPTLPCLIPPDKATGLDELTWTHLRLSAALLDLMLERVVFRDSDSYRSLAVFSGRRGIHLWVPDKWRDWSNSDDIASLLAAISRLSSSPRVASNMVAVLRADPKGLLFLEQAERYLRSHALCRGSPLWDRTSELDPLLKIAGDAGREWDLDTVQTMSVMLLAPRVDEQVSRSHKHLLKAPFSAHPGSGAIALPFDLHHEVPLTFAGVKLDVRNVEKNSRPLEAALQALRNCTDAAAVK